MEVKPFKQFFDYFPTTIKLSWLINDLSILDNSIFRILSKVAIAYAYWWIWDVKEGCVCTIGRKFAYALVSATSLYL